MFYHEAARRIGKKYLYKKYAVFWEPMVMLEVSAVSKIK